MKEMLGDSVREPFLRRMERGIDVVQEVEYGGESEICM
jgi:hypothetical protein